MPLKRFICICAALVLVLSLAACGEKSPETTETADPVVDTSPVEIDPVTDHAAAAAQRAEAVLPCAESELVTEMRDGALTLLSYTGSGTEVRIPGEVGGEALVAVAADAFVFGSAIKLLILPTSVTQIERGGLSGCTALEYLETPLLGNADAQYLGYLFGSTGYADNARDVPASLVTLSLGEGFSELGDYALYDCNDIQCLMLPQSISDIGDFALYNCTALEQITGLEWAERIGSYALANCTSLVTLTVGEGASEIGFAAFYGMRALQAVTLPFVGDGSAEHGYLGYVFGAEYPDFAAGFYPSKLSRVVILEGCTALENYAFYEFRSLKEIVLPSTLERIGVRAFAGCSKLWSIELPESLTTIRENAFWGCDSLLNVTFVEGLTSIGINAFYHCDSLNEVILPASLESLPASCFAGCIALKTVDLGGVREVGAMAFRNCVSLREVRTAHDVKFEDGNEAAKDLVS